MQLQSRIPDLKRQIREHWDDVHDECPFVALDADMDYETMNQEQRDYYFYWRSMVRKGELLECSRAHIALHVCELVNEAPDPVKAQEEMRFMLENSERWGGIIYTGMIHNAFIHDLDLVIMSGTFVDPLLKKMLMSKVMEPEIGPISYHDFAEFSKVYDYACGDIPMRSALLELTLQAVDRWMRTSTGKGLRETYSKREVSRIALCEYYPYISNTGSPSYLVSYDSYESEQASRFFTGLFKYCEGIVSKDKGYTAPNSNSMFTKEMRAIADLAFKDLRDGAVPKQSSKVVRPDMWSPDDDQDRISKLDRGGSDEPVTKGVVHVPSGMARSKSHPRFEERSKENWEREPPGERSYVSSGNLQPDFANMKDDSLEYYLWWRKEVLEGCYGETDWGYLWLLMSELVNSDEDPIWVRDVLGNMALAYESPSKSLEAPITGTYISHCIVSGVLISSEVVMNDYVLNSEMDGLICGEADRIPPRSLIYLSGLKARSMVADFDEDCAEIACRLIPRIDSMVKGGLCRFCRIGKVKYSVKLYESALYCKTDVNRNRHKIDCNGYIYNKRFCDNLSELLKDVIRAVRTHRGRKQKLNGRACFGVDCTDMILEETEEHFSKARAPVSRDVRLELSGDAIRSAESDLDRTTDLMRTQDADEDVEEVEAPPRQSSGDPWRDFAASLDDKEVSYLRDYLDGTLRRNRGSARIEESLNSKASDTVGDVIMEGREIFEEYLEDIRAALDGLSG